MAVSYLKEHFIFRVMTEDVVEGCEDYTCEKDTDIEEFFKRSGDGSLIRS